jgi:hypothetical protein
MALEVRGVCWMRLVFVRGYAVGVRLLLVFRCLVRTVQLTLLHASSCWGSC